MSASLPLIDNLITYVYQAIYSPPLFSARVTGSPPGRTYERSQH